MKFPRFLFVVVVLVTSVVIVFSKMENKDPFVGRWVLNPALSHFDPGPTPREIVSTFKSVPGGLHLRVQSIGAGGENNIVDRVEILDGKWRDVDSGKGMVVVRPSPTVLQVKTYSENVGFESLLTRTLSSDGNTLTVVATQMDGRGNQHREVLVFEKVQ